MTEKKDITRSCADCAQGSCNVGDIFPSFCTTTNMDPAVLADAMKEYEKEEVRRLTVAAAEVETDNYCKMTRLEETVQFAKKIGAKKIGLITCVGLLSETRTVAKVFRSHGFEVYGFACKAGMQKKVNVGIPEYCNATGENMCNPILQAKLANAAHTDLNILIGLCVGHDSMVYRYSEAPVTTLVAKDRVLGHNTVAAIYQAEGYYKKKLFGDEN